MILYNIWFANTSAQITVTQQRLQYRNNSECILDVDDVKRLVSILYFDYNN